METQGKVIKKNRKTRLQETSFQKDEFGNKLMIFRYEKSIRLALNLKNEGRNRMLGIINLASRTMLIKRKRNVHLYEIAKSYCFNFQMLVKAKTFDDIILEDEYSKWKVPRVWMLENCRSMGYYDRGFETQVMISLAQLEQFKLK